MSGSPILAAGASAVVIDHEVGGRLASLVASGHELLVGRRDDPMRWGSFPMAPWAGRIRAGRFRHDDVEVQLPLDLPPHAIHGTTYRRPWEEVGPRSIAIDLGDAWPWAGRVQQSFDLRPDRLTQTITVINQDDRVMPVSAGWHPWFRRRIGDARVEVTLPGARMWRRDPSGIPDGTLTDPPAGPWDDCFTDLAGPTVLRWPGVVRLTIESDCRHLVVYDEEPDGVCVEPQSAPPDAHNSGIDVTQLRPGRSWSISTTWRWTPDADPA